MSEYTFQYGDQSQSDVEEPFGSQEDFGPSVSFPGFKFDQAALAALVWNTVRDQVSENEDLRMDVQSYLPHSDTQIMQVFTEIGLTRSGTEILKPPNDGDDVYMVRDSFSGSAVFEQEGGPWSPNVVADSLSSDDEEPPGYDHFAEVGVTEPGQDMDEVDDDIRYDGYDGGPIEFDTMDEAREYAVRISREILDEILDELSREYLGESGVVDMTFDQMEALYMEKVLPEVWQLMEDA